MRRTTILIATCALFSTVLGLHIVHAQAKSVVEGVYTAEQAKKGAEVYKEQCAACHGDDLKGNDIIPGLAGASFVANWTGKSVGDLWEKINATMPALSPGSLTPDQTAQLIAAILSSNTYPAGTTALATSKNALTAIKIDKK